jgi:hypothetical protein
MPASLLPTPPPAPPAPAPSSMAPASGFSGTSDNY